MKNFFTIYTLTENEGSKKAVKLLDTKGLSFVVVVVDKNEEFAEKVKTDMRMDSFPIILQHIEPLGVKIIGGYEELEKHISTTET